MEKLQNLKHCPWISDEMSISSVKDNHLNTLMSMFAAHPSKVGCEKACREFFNRNIDSSLEEEGGYNLLERENVKLAKLSDAEEIERDIGIDLLTVPNEMPSGDKLDDAVPAQPRLVNSWFEGSYCDLVVPEGGSERLLTLHNQALELKKRTSIGDYGSLRYRTLKYFTTMRLPLEVNKLPSEHNFTDDVMVFVRVQRPYFKKYHYAKPSDKFPGHAQELIFRGKQSLTYLRDAIECVNDFAVNHDFVDCPDLSSVRSYKRAKEEFPSGMFYINGTFYVDLRSKGSKDYSDILRKWAKKIPEIGELRTQEMESTSFDSLTLRLGYPYLYMHQGYCEHLITFTDVRLQERSDLPSLASYPVTRGHAVKLGVRCCACYKNLAVWLVIGYSLLPYPRSLMCDECLKSFCYDNEGVPKGRFKLYPFYDEGTMHIEKLLQNSGGENSLFGSDKQLENDASDVEIDIDDNDDNVNSPDYGHFY